LWLDEEAAYQSNIFVWMQLDREAACHGNNFTWKQFHKKQFSFLAVSPWRS
jgi:hypothetical protein